jgi:hypothetical protein
MLAGLIDCLPHQAITPLDAFLDRLEVVLVLDDMGGKYRKLTASPLQIVCLILSLTGMLYVHVATTAHIHI